MIRTALLFAFTLSTTVSAGESVERRARAAVDAGLRHLASTQARNGRWDADSGMYPTAMTSLAGMTFLMDGHTTMQGRHAPAVQAAVGYLLDQVQANGLIGDPRRDSRYMYGHGFAMLFLSQVLGEEQDAGRRQRLVQVLTRAVDFCGQAQTKNGGWGYVSALENANFDEGSVTVTQMQSLRACRNAGIPVPKDIVDKGIEYIRKCTDEDGGVRYALANRGAPRPPITAAALVCLFSAGAEGDPLLDKLTQFSDKSFGRGKASSRSYGHWHYAHYYYSQSVYRRGNDTWTEYRERVFPDILDQQDADGTWDQGYIGRVYTTSLNLAILQMGNGILPIYQR